MRPTTDADGRQAPMVPETETRRAQPDGGRRGESPDDHTVLAEIDAPSVPDLR